MFVTGTPNAPVTVSRSCGVSVSPIDVIDSGAGRSRPARRSRASGASLDA